MAHPAIFPRRGSSTGSGNISALAAAAGSSISNNVIPPDDYQSPLLIQPPPPAGSSSPVPQHPPQSLNLLSQSQLQAQPLQSAGAQMKKKSGFQITSVTPAQISVSTNNSIAEDTESYDDLDESHTEDLSSSEILDVSLSRATDLGGPERSSSEETLNNFHEAETPGAVSPNQPHPASPPSRRRRHPPRSPAFCPKLPVGAGAALENASVVLPQPLPASGLGAAAGMLPAPAATAVSMSPLASIASSAGAGVGSSAGAPSLGGSGAVGTCSSSSGLPPGMMSLNASGQNVGGSGVAMGAAPASSTMAAAGGGPGSLAALVQASAPAVAPQGQPQQTQAAPPAAASSRFRVVKLDSSSEPFRKGRWTCTEYYDKEAAAPAAPPSDGPPGHRLVESLRQTAPESAAGSERESTSGSSVSSTVSTLSHYTESVGSGEASVGHPGAVLSQQQLPYSQKAGQPAPAGVAPQQMGFPAPQPSAAPTQMPPAHAMPPPPQGILQQSTPSPPQMTQTAQGGILPQVVPAGVSGLAQQLAKAHPQPPGLLQPQTQLSVEQQQQPPPLAPGLAGQQPAGIAVSQVTANVPPSLPQPSMAQSAAQPVQNGRQGALPPATSQYPNLPPLTATQLEDARRFLLQEQSLLSLPKLAAGECASEAGTSLAHDPSGGINALAASATLLPLKTLPLATHVVDGEDDSFSVETPSLIQAKSSGIVQTETTVTATLHTLCAGYTQVTGEAGFVSVVWIVEELPLAWSGGFLSFHQERSAVKVACQRCSDNQYRELKVTGTGSKIFAKASSRNQENWAQNLSGRTVHRKSYHTHITHMNINIDVTIDININVLHRSLAYIAQKVVVNEKKKTKENRCSSRCVDGFSPETGHCRCCLCQDASLGGNGFLLGSGVIRMVRIFFANPLAGVIRQQVSSGASVVAIDNKIEQAMDLVKSHLMYAVREEVEVLKEQIKELIERNSQLEQENNLLKNLASPEQLAQFQAQLQSGSPPASSQPPGTAAQQAGAPAQPASQSAGPSA
ncbi:T22D1 protein, partial [Atractosteus spatula]|nr:T22D1 protein [Atractosteus spatula]